MTVEDWGVLECWSIGVLGFDPSLHNSITPSLRLSGSRCYHNDVTISNNRPLLLLEIFSGIKFYVCIESIRSAQNPGGGLGFFLVFSLFGGERCWNRKSCLSV